MKGLFSLAVLATLLLVSPTPAQLISFNKGKGKGGAPTGGGNGPPFPAGPWYSYWPLEAHFQVPAVPQYPYWSAPQTLPVAPPAPYNAHPMPGAYGNYTQNANPYGGGYPGMAPYGAAGGYPPMGMPNMGMPSYPTMSPYPGGTASPGVMPSMPTSTAPQGS